MFGRGKLQNGIFPDKDHNIPLNWEEWQTGKPVTKDFENSLIIVFCVYIESKNEK